MKLGPEVDLACMLPLRITGVDESFYTFPLSYYRSGDSSISDSDTLVRSETVALEPPSYSLTNRDHSVRG